MQSEEEGEIVDDEIEGIDSMQIKGTSEKLQQRNFRKSNKRGSSDENDETTNFNKNRSDDKKIRFIDKRRQFDEYGKRKQINDPHKFSFNRKQYFRDRPNFRRIKLPSNLKYTISKPSISFAENPRAERCSILTKKLNETITKSSDERAMQSHPESLTTVVQVKEKISFTPSPPIKEPTSKITSSQTNSKESERKEVFGDSVLEIVESPPRSPVLQLQCSPENSSTSTLFVRDKSLNVCSFLSDIESEGYLSSFSLLNELDSDENDQENKQATEKTVSKNVKVIEDIELNTQNSEIDDNSSNSDDSDDSDDSSLSDDSSSSTTLSSESEEDSSDTSSNEDLTPSGFGKFSHLPPFAFAPPFTTITKTETTTIDMQVKSSITKPAIFTATPCVRPSPIALKPGGLIAPNFPVPFKIYSIRDFSSTTQLTQSIASTPVTTTPSIIVKASPKESKDNQERSRRSRSKSLDRRRSSEREVRNRKNDRKRSPPSLARKRNSKSPTHIVRRRSSTPILPQKNTGSHSRHSSPRSRRVSSSFTSSSRKSIQRPRSKERSRKRSHSPEAEKSSRLQKPKFFKENDKSLKREISPDRYGENRLDSTATIYSDDDTQSSFRRSSEKRDSTEISHMANDDSNCYSSFYFSQNFNYQEDYNYIPMEEQQQYYDEFYTSSKSFINQNNLVEITQQQRNHKRAESNQIAVQVGNVLEIVPNTEIISSEQNKTIQIDPKELKVKRKLLRDRKRKLKKKRKEQLRKEIQRYFDEGINIEDSEDEEIYVGPIINVQDKVKGIIKTSEAQKKENRRVMFGDGFYPHESSDHEELSFDEKLNRKAIRKQVVKKSRIAVKTFGSSAQLETEMKIKKHAEYFENILPPSPPLGQPSEKCPQPQLKRIPPDLFASFSINFNPIYYFLQKYQYHQNGYSLVKSTNSLSIRNLNTSDPRLNSSTTSYNRFS